MFKLERHRNDGVEKTFGYANYSMAVLNQLAAYGALAWLTFIAATAACTFFWGLRGFAAAIGSILAFVVWSDVRWIRNAMAAPGWNGTPDQDGLFVIGMILRCIMVACVLVPIGVAATYIKRFIISHWQTVA